MAKIGFLRPWIVYFDFPGHKSRYPKIHVRIFCHLIYKQNKKRILVLALSQFKIHAPEIYAKTCIFNEIQPN
jgi:hypothetical protein